MRIKIFNFCNIDWWSELECDDYFGFKILPFRQASLDIDDKFIYMYKKIYRFKSWKKIYLICG